jgi:arylsulfatase A-like enzyme
LDALNLVWPDYSVKGLKLPLTQAAEAQGAIDRFLAEVAERLVPELKVDLVLFYQPLLDTLGHELQNRLPLPFQSKAQDEVTKTFLAGFQIVDRNLDRLLSTADAKTPIVLVGDHGMDAIERMVNLSALLRPSQKKLVRFVTSGQLVLLYPAEPQFAAAADKVGQDLKQKLTRLRNPDGKPTLAQAARRSDAVKKGRNSEDEWQFGEALWAFQGLSGDWITFDPRSQALFQAPRAGGMHGTSSHVESMATRMLIHGPDVKPARIAQASLLSAVPSLTQMMGIKPPHDCVGVSLLQGQNITRR